MFVEGKYFRTSSLHRDGSSLFIALSFALFGNADRAPSLREEVVNSVCCGWDRLGDDMPYESVDDYRTLHIINSVDDAIIVCGNCPRAVILLSFHILQVAAC